MADAAPTPGVIESDVSFVASDGCELRGVVFTNTGDSAVRGTLLAVHGIQSHAGWYGGSSRWLAERGYDVVFFDRRGSGKSGGLRGDCPNWQRLCQDLAEAAEFSRRRRLGLPLYLCGISWGGKLSIAAVAGSYTSVDGLILLCPGIFPRIDLSIGEKLGIATAAVFQPKRRFPIPLSNPELFTVSVEWQDYLRNDELSLHQATARFMVASKLLDRFIAKRGHTLRVPTLLILAGQDRIIDNAKTRAFIERMATSDRTIVEFADAHHTIEFEPDLSPLVRAMADWLDARAAHPLSQREQRGSPPPLEG